MSATEKSVLDQFEAIDKELINDVQDDTGDVTSDEQVKEIDKLLAGEDLKDADESAAKNPEEIDEPGEQGGTDDAEADPGDQETEPKIEAIDYTKDFDVPMPNGNESVTIGKLKDHYVEHDIKMERLEKRDLEQMHQERYLNDLMQLTGYISPEMKRSIDENKQRRLVTENRLLNAAVPEWKEPGVYTRDSKTMNDLAKDFGFTAKELGAVIDHRLVKLVREFALLREKVAGAKARPTKKTTQKTQSRKAGKTGKVSTDKLAAVAAKSDNPALKLAAIDKLLE